MGYCAASDVAGDFKGMTFSSSTIVTDTTVAGFITEASALIDSFVGQRFVTPITGDASSLSLMSLYCRTIVVDRVRSILSNQQTTNKDANQNVRGAGFKTSDVMDGLKAIKNGEMQLSGASLLLDNAGFRSHNSERNVRGHFHKNRRQW